MEEEFIPHSQNPYASGDNEKGYSEFMEAFGLVIFEKAQPLILKALDGIDFDPKLKRAFTLVDYGCSDGGMSMDTFQMMIDAVKTKYGTNQELQILYEEQATSDFNSLFRNMHSNKTGLKSGSYLKRYKNIYVNACATNFYDQCFPTESIDFGLSSTAMCWLYKRPCVLTTSLWPMFSTNETESQIFTECAKRDYERFLVKRANELVPGGALVLCNMTFDKSKEFEEGLMNRKQPYEMLEKYWRDMLNEGVISKKEYEETTFNYYLMTKDEFVAPFNDQTSEPYKAGLRLEVAKTELLTCVLTERMSKATDKDRAALAIDFAKTLAMQTRQWSNWTFMTGLSKERTEEDKCAIVDNLFKRYEDDIARAPAEFGEDTVETYLVIRKCH